ncbi:MAG TPA: sigma-70 family RNA polymerase sigma factor [Candidatus Lustribacter sp.]|nr:sigma-70 family RNA polymerase sigma factor [Candidatus Lustribacter sp.]
MIERQTLIERYLADRSHDHRDTVIAAHMYLCKRGARKFRRPESDPADLEQVAAIGLIKATETYLPERSTPFEPYAWILIVGELMHYVRDSESAIRIPRRLRSLDRRYVAMWEALAARHQAEPTPRQLAHALEVSLDVVEQVQALRRGHVSESDARGAGRLDALAAPARGISLDERLTLLEAVEGLPRRERIIVLGTFGAGLSQTEVAHVLGLSQSQISKLLARALSTLSQRVA